MPLLVVRFHMIKGFLCLLKLPEKRLSWLCCGSPLQHYGGEKLPFFKILLSCARRKTNQCTHIYLSCHVNIQCIQRSARAQNTQLCIEHSFVSVGINIHTNIYCMCIAHTCKCECVHTHTYRKNYKCTQMYPYKNKHIHINVIRLPHIKINPC